MQENRRRVLRQLGAGLAGSALAPGLALAQAAPFPARPVRVIYPFSAGGLGDSVARTLFKAVGERWLQPVVIDNKPGAGGLIGADQVAKADPDGHTLLLTFSALLQVPHLVAKAPFDPVRDFAPITEVAATHAALVVRPDVPVRTVKEFVAYVREQGQPFAYGTYGIGSTGHVLMEVLARQAAMKVTAVPYKGEAPMLTDMLGGQVRAGFLSASVAAQQVQAGKLRVLAVAGEGRSPLLPDVPNFSEAGFSQIQGSGWIGLFAPARTPRAVIDQVATDVNRALSRPEVRVKLEEFGLVVRGTAPASFGKAVRQQNEYWANAIRSSNIRLD